MAASIGLWLAVALGACVTAAFGVALVRRYALRRSMLDVPNERSSHTRPTPRGGGLALVATTLGGLAAAALWMPELRTLPYAVAFACLTGIALLSWVDDVRSVPHGWRLVGHLTAAVLVVAVFGSISTVSVPLIGTVSLGRVAPLITVLWIVGLTNAFNFMDGIDGIAGIQAVIAGIGLALFGAMFGAGPLTIAGVLLAGAAAGFLIHNWPPASIFMGDVGSAFAGFYIAVAVTAAVRFDDRVAMAGVLLVAPFVIDTAFTFARRLRRGENVFAAHRSHLYQRLVIAGLPHGRVTMAYGVLAALGTVLAMLWLRAAPTADHLAAAFPVVCLAALLLWVRQRESRRGRSARSGLAAPAIELPAAGAGHRMRRGSTPEGE